MSNDYNSHRLQPPKIANYHEENSNNSTPENSVSCKFYNCNSECNKIEPIGSRGCPSSKCPKGSFGYSCPNDPCRCIGPTGPTGPRGCPGPPGRPGPQGPTGALLLGKQTACKNAVYLNRLGLGVDFYIFNDPA